MKKLLILSVALFSCNSFAEGGEYHWKVNRVIDGDTIGVEEHFYPKELGSISIRIAGIDTPEKYPRSKCAEEHILAQKATEFVRAMVPVRSIITVRNVERDKYGGRLVAEVFVKNKSIASMLVGEGLARAYLGGAKESWCSK